MLIGFPDTLMYLTTERIKPMGQVKSDKPGMLITCVPFSGFYETWHGQMLNDEIDSLFQNDYGDVVDVPEGFEYQYDYKAMETAYSKRYVDAFKDRLNEDGISLQSLEFEKLVSPREYNFTTDRIFAYISPEDVQRLWDTVSMDILKLKIKERFTSRSGFASSYSNDIENWRKPLNTWDHNELETLILAHMTQAGIEDDSLEAHELMENDRGNGVIHNIVWDNLKPEGVIMANAWSERHRPDGQWKD
jgi:hypothetical protein